MSNHEADAPADLLAADPEFSDRLDRLCERIETGGEFLVASHVEPDGDAIASTLAVGDLLRRLDNTVVTYNRDGVPYNFEFVEGAQRLETSLSDVGAFDALVLLDCSNPERAGGEVVEASYDEVVVMDHHDTVDRDACDLVVCDSSAAATAEVVFRAARRLGVEIDRRLAEPLYAALMTDTGSFQYANTSRSTFRIAGELLEAGVDPWRITVEVFESQPRHRVELLGEVLETLEFEADGRIAFIRIDRQMVEDADRDVAQLTDGFINYGRSIRGVEVSVQLRELAENDWKISFRSKGRVDVSKLAERHGGGGHVNAAGCRVAGEPEEIRSTIAGDLTDLI